MRSPRWEVPRLPWKTTLSHQQRVISPVQAVPRQAVPRHTPVDSTLSPVESEISQAGSSQASLEDNTLSLAESELSQASSPSSLEDGTLQAESSTPPQAVRCSARLRARQAGTLLGRTLSSLSERAPFPKGYFLRTMLPKKQGPPPVGITPCRVLPPHRNLTQSG